MAAQQPITSLIYYLTEACNLRCTYCYLQKRPTRRSSYQIGQAVIDFLCDCSYDAHDVHLRFFGGEPMLEMNLIEKIVVYGRRRAKESGKRIRYDMVSNGTLAVPNRVEKLRELNIEVTTSVDGSRETMKANRPSCKDGQDLGDFEKNIKHIISSGVGRIGRMTFSPEHCDAVNDLKYVLGLGYEAIMIATASNVRWQAKSLERIYQDIASFYIESAREARILPLIVTNQLLVLRHEIDEGTYVPPTEGFCGAGKKMLGVAVNGDLYPCHRFVQLGEAFRLGSVFDGLAEERRKSYLHMTREIFHHVICNCCPASAFCPGSCMAANFLAVGKLHYPEARHCLDLRAHVTAANEIYKTLMKEGCPAFIEFLEEAWRSKRHQRLLALVEKAGGG